MHGQYNIKLYFQFHFFWKLSLTGKYNSQFSQLHYGLWDSLLMKLLFVTLQSVQNFCHKQWEHCCFVVMVFSVEKKNNWLGEFWMLVDTCGFGLYSVIQLEFVERRLLLAQTTHPSLLHSVIVIGFHPCFMWKEMLQEHMMFIMRIEIRTVQFWHLHRVIRKTH